MPKRNAQSPEDKISDEQIQSILKSVFEQVCQNEDSNLQERFKTIVHERIFADKGQKKRLKDLSEKLDVSVEQVRQNEAKVKSRANKILSDRYPKLGIDIYTDLKISKNI